MIQGILTCARIGRDANGIEEININALLNEILENLPIKHGLNVIVQKDMPILFSEKVPLIQIFTNLISNAIKYHNKQNGEIKIYYKEDKGRYKFFEDDDWDSTSLP